MPLRLSALVAFAVLALAPVAHAQSVDVTFRFLPDLNGQTITPGPVVRAFTPGSFNDFGPNTDGRIATDAPSRMTFNESLNEYRLTTSLAIGQGPASGGYPYKIHYHRNDSGSEYTWITDPLGTETTGQFNDSVVRVEELFVFQIAREQNGDNRVAAVSAGVFGVSDVTDVDFRVNNTTYEDPTDTGDGIYRVVLPEAILPGAFVEVTATDGTGRTVTTSIGTAPPAGGPPTVVDMPVPEGLVDGINYDEGDPTTATLVLRAPDKAYVYALGAFNDWEVSEDALMFRDDDAPLGTRWWIEVDGLTPGAEVPFYYFVDGLIRVADPYTTKVVYPGEDEYPEGAQDHAVGVLTPGAAEFDWTDDDFEAPDQEDLVIYELLLRDFVADRSFTTLADTLGYLERLGVNAIELMPVAEYDGDQSWGYNPAFHFALDKTYGTPDEFKAFVDAAHARGMAVILDVVYNHATGQSPLIRLYNEGDFGAPTADNPWANPQARHPFNVFNDLNHESELTQLWLDRANRFWIEEYHVDGYRYDLSKGFTQTQTSSVDAWIAYDQSRVDLLTRMADSLWAVYPEATIILEHFGSTQEEDVLTRYEKDENQPGMMVWRKMNREYNQGTMGYPTATDFPSRLDGTYPPNVGLPTANAVTYMESHDEQWLMFRNLTYGNAADGYDVKDLGTALDRQALAGAFFFTVPGPRMLWQFGELGYGGGPGECLVDGEYPGECAQGVPGRVDPKPIRWDYWVGSASPDRNGSTVQLTKASDAERSNRRDLYLTWAGYLDLRNGNEIFRSLDTEVEGRLGLVPDRWITLSLDDAPEGEPTEAVVFGNFGVTETTITVPLGEAATWYDYTNGRSIDRPAGDYTTTLAPGEHHIWTNVEVGSIRSVSTDDTAAESPVPAGLQAVYPNPTAGAATVRFKLDAPREVQIDLFDVLGRQVRTVAGQAYPRGTHEVSFETSGLPAGVYVVRYENETRSITVAR